jgi:hypothetical protein
VTTTAAPPPSPATTTTTAPPPPPPPPATTTTATTPAAAPPNNNNGKKPPSAPGQDKHALAAGVQRGSAGVNARFVDVLRTAVSVRGAHSLRVSLVRAAGLHRRLPLLARSRVGAIKPAYWRKTIVTGPMSDGRVALHLRVPKRLLVHGARYALRVRVVEAAGIKTMYVRFRG